MLDYKLLEAFATVIQEGGFEKAANKLFVTQSAISQRIKHLEEQAGQILLTRTSPPQPTSAGQPYLSHYNQVSSLEKELISNQKPHPDHQFFNFEMAINADSLATWFMPITISIAQNLHLTLKLYVDDQEQTHKLLKLGKVSACVSTYKQAIQGCNVYKLGGMDYSLYCSTTFAKRWFPYGVTAAQLKNIPTIRFNHKDTLNDQFFTLHKIDRPLNPPTFNVPSSETFQECIENGLCYGLLPIFQVKSSANSSNYVDLLPTKKITVDLYYHCWNLESEILKSFTRTFIKQAKLLLR